jgi:hypothetical protein
MPSRRRSIELTAAVLILLPLAIAAAPQTPKVCRACRTQCPAEIASCVQADPRLATCSPKRQKFCLRRAARTCKHNLKKCCLNTCRGSGQIVCCGSAISPLPTTTTTTPTVDTTTTSSSVATSSTSTTIPAGSIACTTDSDCPSCGCCNLNSYTCSGATGPSTTICCNVAGSPTPIQQGACGPKTPAVCPATATCPPPGTNVGGTEYGCQWCEGSGAIIEQFFPSNGSPQIYPSNACMRH